MSKITITDDKDAEEVKPVEKEVVEGALQAVQEVDKAKKLKEENDAFELEVARAEELKARAALGGKSIAGQQVVEKSEEEKVAEEAKEILRTFEAD